MTTVLLHEGSAAPKLEPPPRPQVRAVRGGNHGLNRVRHVMRTAVIVLILAVFGGLAISSLMSGATLMELNAQVDEVSVQLAEAQSEYDYLNTRMNDITSRASLQQVAEGAGAVPVAAALFHKLPIEGKKVVCLVSGGNIDVNILNRVITRGLVMSGRKANLTIALEDKPGQLQQVADIVSRCGSNVVSVLHDGSDPNMPISSCFLKLTLETRDNAQIEQIRQELTKAGFQLVAERV